MFSINKQSGTNTSKPASKLGNPPTGRPDLPHPAEAAMATYAAG